MRVVWACLICHTVCDSIVKYTIILECLLGMEIFMAANLTPLFFCLLACAHTVVGKVSSKDLSNGYSPWTSYARGPSLFFYPLVAKWGHTYGYHLHSVYILLTMKRTRLRLRVHFVYSCTRRLWSIQPIEELDDVTDIQCHGWDLANTTILPIRCWCGLLSVLIRSTCFFEHGVSSFFFLSVYIG